MFHVVVRNTWRRGQRCRTADRHQNPVPSANITQPGSGTTYAAGTVMTYAGTGNDAEDGTLPASAFTGGWTCTTTLILIRVLARPGVKSGRSRPGAGRDLGQRLLPRSTSRVRDSGGLSPGIRDILPGKATVTLATNPGGLAVRLDGQPVATPHSFVGVVGIERALEAVSPQGPNWTFSSWSDGGARIHAISTPPASTTYTARFGGQSAVSIAIGHRTRYEGDSGTAGATFAVRLSAPRTVPVTVAWKTTDGSAKAGSDYNAVSGSLSFPPGTTLRTIPIGIRGDSALETSETFYVDLSAPSGASIAISRGIGTILNDDG